MRILLTTTGTQDHKQKQAEWRVLMMIVIVNKGHGNSLASIIRGALNRSEGAAGSNPFTTHTIMGQLVIQAQATGNSVL